VSNRPSLLPSFLPSLVLSLLLSPLAVLPPAVLVSKCKTRFTFSVFPVLWWISAVIAVSTHGLSLTIWVNAGPVRDSATVRPMLRTLGGGEGGERGGGRKGGVKAGEGGGGETVDKGRGKNNHRGGVSAEGRV
jgi:hypothetical protein